MRSRELSSRLSVKVAVLIDSGALAINDGYRVRNSQLGDHGFPFVRGGDIQDGEVTTAVPDHVLPEHASDLQNKLARPGDVAFITKGSVGRVGRVREGAPLFVFAPQVCYWRSLKPEVMDAGFLFYLLQSAPFQANLEAVKTHGSMVADYVSLSDQRNFVLPLPCISEQRGIAEILGALDDKIELNRRMNETLEAIGSAIFRQWIAEVDPRESNCRQSSMGVEVERCGGVIQTGPFGSQLHAADYVIDGIPVVMPRNLARRRVSTDGIARIRKADVDRLSRHRVQYGDIVYSRRGDVEQHALIRKRESGWLCGTGCLLIRMGPGWSSTLFVSFLLDQPESREWLVRHAIGATMPNLNTDILSRAPLLVPPDDLLREFDDFARPLDDRIATNDAESQTLAELRDTLLPKLLSGELRVRDAEKQAADVV